MQKLIIVESPNKVKSIKKYIKELQKTGKLSKEDSYDIESSVGHILEIKKSWDPTKEEEVLDFKKIVIRGKAKVINLLKKKAKKADLVLIATDPDREGEAIADDLITKLEIEDKYQRIVFNEITLDALEEAIKNPLSLNINQVNAQKARMLIDRIFGYKLSKWIRYKLWNDRARSAGRVQSPTLAMVVEREFLIESFKPEEYFKIEQVIDDNIIARVVLDKDMVDNKSNLLDPKKYPEYSQKIKGQLKITDIQTTESNLKAKIPFKQSNVYRVASSRLGLSAVGARAIMQSLYEKGFITYPRTDSTRYSNAFINKANAYIKETFGESYLAKVKGMTSGAQDAHEALRVTDLKNTPSLMKLQAKNNKEYNLYQIIYYNTIHSLMKIPKRETLTFTLDDNGVTFKLSSSRIIYDGYLKAGEFKREKSEKDIDLKDLKDISINKNNYLNDKKWKVGDIITSNKINFIEGETKPKARYNEGTLISAMEEKGIGRPSTFSSTIDTLLKRKYLVKESNALKATNTGKVVAITLMLYFNNIIKAEYTKELEEILDKIAKGEKDYEKVIKNFFSKLALELSLAVIKNKEKKDEDTQYISLSELKNFEENNSKKVPLEKSGAYSKEYYSLVVAFLKYAKFNKNKATFDYKDFVKNEFDKFLGPIVMPLKPKRGRYIIDENNEIHTFRQAKDYSHLEQCSVCNKNVMVYQGGIPKKKRNNIYWMKTCSGWPKVKCDNTTFLEKEDPLFERLEKHYQHKLEFYLEEEKENIKEEFSKEQVPESTIQILIKGL